MDEASIQVDCFGGRVEVMARGRSAGTALDRAARRIRELHARLSRFIPDSELSELNRDPRSVVEASDVMLAFLDAAIAAGRMSGGLVDVTCLDAVEACGYAESRSAGELRDAISLERALELAPPRRPATADPRRRWSEIGVNHRRGVATRPPGLRLDSGGIAKGLGADLVARELRDLPAWAVNCAGDLRIGGMAGEGRVMRIDDPFGAGTIDELTIVAGSVATSGIGRRSWRSPVGAPAHHLIDPARGRPAYTGVVQATALAPTGVEAEVRAKCALLAGPTRAPLWLSDGGVLVLDDTSVHKVGARSQLAA